MTAYEVYLPLVNTLKCFYLFAFIVTVIWSKVLEEIREGGLKLPPPHPPKKEKEKSIWLSINLLMTASGLIWHIWYQTQTEVLCWDKLEQEQLRGVRGWPEGRVSVYAVMLMDLAFPLFRQVGIKLNGLTLAVLFALAPTVPRLSVQFHKSAYLSKWILSK